MNVTLSLLVPAALAALIAYALTPWASRLANRVGAIDQPGPRKMHTAPIPRLGGVAVVPAMLITLALLPWLPLSGMPALRPALWLALIGGLLPIFVVSCWDDIRSVRPLWKLVAQILGAVIAVASGLRLDETVQLFGHVIPVGVLAFPLSILWIVGVTNAFNLVDGLDGLSAGLGLISAASLGAVAVLTLNRELAVLAVVVLGALSGFIPYNIHPARVFLGDCGATAAGYYLACLALMGSGTLSAGMAVLVPVVVMGVPVADTLLSIVRRAIRALNRRTVPQILQADSEHIHHRLVQLGLTYHRSVLILYGAGLSAAGIAIASLFVTASNAGLLLATLLVAGFIGVSRLGYDEFAVLRRGVILKVYDSAVLKSGHFRVFVDIGFVVLAFYGALALKYDDWNLQANRALFRDALAFLLPVNVIAFWAFRLYQRAWRFASIADVISVTAAVTVGSVAGFVLTRLLIQPEASPTLFIIYTLLLVLGVSVGRSSFRLLMYLKSSNGSHGRRVAVYGAGSYGLMAVEEMQRTEALAMIPVGFVDDDPVKSKRRLGGLQVLGDITELQRIIHDHRVEAVLIASETIAPDRLQMAIGVCAAADVEVFRFNVGVQSLSSGTAASAAVHPVRVPA